ncbi:30S ribosomal protein S4 [Actinomadura madurae]|uniref:Small ribosomal subunit protein uS4 n=1 Tax=Actinomadura madurae TaxID=1993 RepID=A0A1I5QHD9_9ACTN|nr:30S ribosomal protein S4 [Actinomadura madurae]MCP9970516.1 30S ribosomal protein S4 [Actinomadura madurae]URM99242.1 30S ribosomal protein S4 [Actinomadura madurae]URN09924.1 30S ribosomal protein S4 [Actinomadura madurae]SFP45645.1 SSU ribosomal protein S4P [Actinomadura madurae]
MNNPRPKVRISRALGIPLTPKSVKYFEARPYPPGVHGRARKQETDYKVRLREKQRLRAQYNIREAQLRNAFAKAAKAEGKTGEALLVDLERRLDALVLRAGFARTIYQARQFVVHRHVLVNGRRVDRPSYRLRPGDVITVAERSRSMVPFQVAAAGGHAETVPPYLDVRHDALAAQLTRLPARSEIPVICDEQLVVEHYSR